MRRTRNPAETLRALAKRVESGSTMPPIDELVSADRVNTPVAIGVLAAFHVDVVPTFELAADLFEGLIRNGAEAFARLDANDEERLNGLSAALGVTAERLVNLVQGPEGQPGVEGARTLWNAMRSRQAQRLLLLLLYRYFRWGVSDLIRLRVTPVAGYARLQAETVALLSLFDETPALASDWLRASLTTDGGRKFFRQTQGDLNRLMAREGVANFYERGSSSFQHVRMTSAVPGLKIGDGATRLQDQEFDPDDVGSYIRRSLWFMSAQVPIFASLARVIGGQGAVLEQQRGDFNQRWAALWQLMETRYPLPNDVE